MYVIVSFNYRTLYFHIDVSLAFEPHEKWQIMNPD